MPYDPATGEWQDEDLSVSNRLTGLLKSDSPYMQTADQAGRREANRRGLLNSTMAVSAIQDSRIRHALPIAAQESSQAHQRYTQGRGLQQADFSQQRQFQQDTEMQLRDIAMRHGMQEREIAYLNENQIRDIASREGMQESELRNLIERTEMDLASRERIATGGFELEREQAALDREQQQWLSSFNRETQERLQQFDSDTRLQLAALDTTSAERIAQMNVATSQLNNAASLAASFESFYADMLLSISNNANIPAAERQEYMDHANRMRDSNYALLETLYGFELEWAA